MNEVSELVAFADVDDLDGDWTATTANQRCQEYARLIHQMFPRCDADGEFLRGVVRSHHCS